MKSLERVQLVSVSLIFACWVAMIVNAWHLLVTHLSFVMWLPIVAIHGGALGVAVLVYLRSRKPPALTGMEVLNLLVLWMMTWVLDFSIFTRLGK